MQPLRPRLRPLRAALGALIAAFAVVASLVTATATPAQADTTLCEPFGTTTIQGRYVVQNNRWGTSAPQCVTSTATGFRIDRADGASYDIWLDPTPRTDGVNRTEIMIWFNRVGPIQPIGSPVGTATVGGRNWEVWTGSNGSNDVLSFVAPSAISSWSFDVMDFVRATVARGLAQNDWYLTSVQAGFEPWQNGAGLSVNSFSSTVETGGTPGGPGTDPGPGGPTACEVTYDPHVWQSGFTADVTVRNTGQAPVDTWRLAFALPSGQRITNAWNASVSPDAGTVTATGVGHNARIAAGGSVTFGFQGTYGGAYAEPSGFRLNDVSCTTA